MFLVQAGIKTMITGENTIRQSLLYCVIHIDSSFV